MEDIEIVKQLMSGNHLEPEELDRAEALLHSFIMSMKGRGRKVILKILDSLDRLELNEVNRKSLNLWIDS